MEWKKMLGVMEIFFHTLAIELNIDLGAQALKRRNCSKRHIHDSL